MRKKSAKPIALIIALSLVFSSAVPAFAEEGAAAEISAPEEQEIDYSEGADEVSDPGAEIVPDPGTEIVQEPEADTAGPDDEAAVFDAEPGGEEEKPVYQTGLYKVNGVWKYYQNGRFSKKTGAVKQPGSGKIFYVKNGIFNQATGIAKSLFNDKCYYVKNGVLRRATGVARSLFNKKSYYVKNGVFIRSTGAARKISDKKLCYVKNGVMLHPTGVAKSLFNDKFYYLRNGALRRATGVAKVLNGSGFRYVKNGVGTAFSGYAELINDGRLFRIDNGKYDGVSGVLPEYTGEYNGLYYEKGYRLTGFRLIGRDCYYYKEGILTGNTRAMGLTIDASGKAVSPLENLIPLQAKLIAASITDDTMSMDEKLWACFEYVISIRQTRGNPRIPHYTGIDWPYIYANDVFGSRNGGNCFSYAAAFAFLAKACGFENVFACSSGGHGWTEVDQKLYDPEQYMDGAQVIYGVSIYDSSVSDYKRMISLLPDGSYQHVRIPEI